MNALQLVNEVLSRFGEKEVSSLTETAEATLILRKVNMAIHEITSSHPFIWAENEDPRNLTAVEGTSVYNLYSDVARILVAKHRYNGGGWIKFIDRATLEQYRADRSQTSDRNTPRFVTTAGVYQATAATLPVIRAEFWPVPDSNFDGELISYYYTRVPAELAVTTDIPIIPQDFHWLIIEKAESLYRRGPIRVGGDGLQSQIDLFSIAEAKYKEGLAALISRDSAISSSEMTWNVEDSYI